MKLLRLFKFGWENVWRNGWLSVITTTTIILTLFSVSMVLALSVGIGQVVESVEERINLSVYFYPSVTEEQINSVIASLNSLPAVRDIKYVTKEQALARYKDQAAARPELLNPLAVLQDNPFGSSLAIQSDSAEGYKQILDEINKPQYKDLIEDQQKDYEENQSFINAFSSFTNKVRSVGLAMTAAFAIIAALLLYNAIRVAIYTHRNEITVMKLVGASNWFVRAPFLIEVAFLSLIGGAISIALTLGALYFIQPYLSQYFGAEDITVLSYFITNALVIFGAELLAMLILSILSGSIALRRYLRI